MALYYSIYIFLAGIAGFIFLLLSQSDYCKAKDIHPLYGSPAGLFILNFIILALL